MSALSWLNDLARWLASWVPRLTLIPPTHRAILFGPRGGAAERGPGLVFWWPIAQKMRRVPVVAQPMETCARLLPLWRSVGAFGGVGGAEGIVPKAAACGLVIEFTIVNPLLAALATINLHAIIDNRIQAHFGEEWRSIEDADSAADRTAAAVAPDLLHRFGVRIDVLRVGNVGPVASVKLVNDWSHQHQVEAEESREEG